MSISQNFPSITPSLLLDFCNTKSIDPRFVFARSSIGTYVDSEGVVRTAVAGEGRTTHDLRTKKCLGYLTETQKTNRCLYSEDFSNPAWVASNITVTANNGVAPDENTTADLLTATANDATIIQDLGVVASGAKYGSVFLRRSVGTGNVYLTLDGGTTWTLVNIDSDWIRVGIPQTVADEDFGIKIETSGDAIFAWGGSVEDATFASSYIPTDSAQVTRSSDSCYLTGANFSSWFNAPGSVLVEFTNYDGTDYGVSAASAIKALLAFGTGVTNRFEPLICRDDGSRVNLAAAYYRSSTQTLVLFERSNNSYPVNQESKIAIGMKNNDYAQVLNGSLLTSVSASDVIGNILRVGARYDGVPRLNGVIKKIAFYQERLPNEILETIAA